MDDWKKEVPAGLFLLFVGIVGASAFVQFFVGGDNNDITVDERHRDAIVREDDQSTVGLNREFTEQTCLLSSEEPIVDRDTAEGRETGYVCRSKQNTKGPLVRSDAPAPSGPQG